MNMNAVVRRNLPYLLWAATVNLCLAFAPSPRAGIPMSTTRLNVAFEPSSFITAVDIFDGSQVVDPVISSGVYWATIKSKILLFIAGQISLLVLFVVLTGLLARKAGDQISYTIQNGSFRTPKGTPLGTEDFVRLLACVAIDLIGSSSELLPGIGELTDIVYAPVAATVLRSLFGSNVVFGLEFIEEILPFVDFLPLATICWVVDTFAPESRAAEFLRIGKYGFVRADDPSIVDEFSSSKIEDRRS